MKKPPADSYRNPIGRALRKLSAKHALIDGIPTMTRGVHNGHKRGSENGNSKLREDDVKIIRREVHTPDVVLAARYGVTDRTIRLVRAGTIWRHV